MMETETRLNPRQVLSETMSNLPKIPNTILDVERALEEIGAMPDTIEPVEQPRIYQLETTSRCNLLCPFCPRTIDLVKNHQRNLNETMSLDRFVGILNSMPWLKSLELFHFGEPFLHADFYKYIQACTDRGIYSVVASNMTVATAPKIDAAFNAGLGFLVMDLDSLDPKRYAEMRVNGKLDEVRRHIRYALQRRAPKPFMVVQTIMLNEKPEFTQEEFSEWSGRLLPDEIRYKFLDSFRGAVKDKGTLGPHDLCREPFYGFTVHVNGNVVPCDRDWAGENVMGNVFEQSIEEIWHGEKYQAFRAAMKSTEKPAMCRNCPEGRLVNLRSQDWVQVNMFRGREVEHP